MRRYVFVIILLISCKDVYNPTLKQPGYNYLVVEGNIVAGNDSTIVHLTRTVNVSDTNIIHPELNATIKVESETGATYFLQEQGNGFYVAPQLNVSPNENYRLHIFTANGKEYASDYVPVIQTPPIDSVSWKFDSTKGVDVYVSTHDATNNSQYYQWNFTETWQYRATYTTVYIFENGSLRERNPDELITNCWTIVPSSSINISSTAQLSSDVVFERQLANTPYGSEKLSIVYSILVQQYALSKQAFEFWENLKKNTEELGTIFDPQPFADFGNIHCITSPLEPVIGFISASSISQQRIYIRETDLPSWPNSLQLCKVDTLKPSDDFNAVLGGGGRLALSQVPISGVQAPGYTITDVDCADCRLHGGSTIKPPYMP